MINEIYKSSYGILYNGNSLELLKSLEPNDYFIFADPPYNFKMKYDEYDDNKKPEEYKEWCEKWFIECYRIAKRIVITPGHGNVFMWGNIKKPTAMGAWYKPNNWTSGVIGNAHFEPYLYWAKYPHVHTGGNNTIVANNEAHISLEEKGNHPCPKPILFMKKILHQFCKNNWIVIDPFMGSGTTAIAAEKMNIRWIGCELSKNYCKTIKRRVEEIKSKETMENLFFE